MTKKDFELIAKLINLSLDDAKALGEPMSETQKILLVKTFAHGLEQEGGNPNFDYARFCLACGVDDERSVYINQN